MKVEIISNEYIWQSNQEFFFYDKSKDLRIKDLLEQKGEEWLQTRE
jgi:hypothetical protein